MAEGQSERKGREREGVAFEGKVKERKERGRGKK